MIKKIECVSVNKQREYINAEKKPIMILSEKGIHHKEQMKDLKLYV